MSEGTSGSDMDEVRIPIGIQDLQSYGLLIQPPPDELFHYTSMEGASGIIESKSLRLTKFAYLNDTSELKLAVQLFGAVVESSLKSLSCDDEKILLSDAAKGLGSMENINICVGSFCENENLLSQWHGYGSVGRGVALGFSTKAISQASCVGRTRLIKCIYDRQQQLKVARDLVDLLLNSCRVSMSAYPSQDKEVLKANLIGYFYNTFLQVAPSLKSHHYAQEQEWRIVTSPISCNDPKYCAVVSTARVSEYYSFSFSAGDDGKHNFLTSVVIGPALEPTLILGAIDVLCHKNGIRPKSLRPSLIPYRG